ncbi:hypothetical protein Taro_004804 [Colocasia esculenta]|uniref:Ubiquitin-like protease family profile domain-containing protein n=1 Tax=Colocasia esculenta TaxID=4460 RepID=A0A843TSP9_COLES|nr:hypothetical protein [Colocasia esculenta]
MRNSPFHAYVKCEMVTYPISLLVDLMTRFDGEHFKIGPCSLPFRSSDIATVMGIPNVGSPIDLKMDGTNASLRRIIGSKQTMDRHNIHLKLREYVPQEGALAVDISVKLWVVLLYSYFFFPTSGRSGLPSILPYLDNLHEMKNANWAAAIHEYLISGVKAFRTAAGSSKTIFLTGCVLALGEDQRKKEAQRKKQEEEAERKREEEEDEHRKKMEEEEEEKKRKRRQISPSSLSRRVSAGMRIRRQPECYTVCDDKSKKEHFEYAFRKLDRAPNEFDLIFSPMHVGMNHWALLVIHIKEKEFHVYDSLRSKHRADIPQYVEELKRYLKGKHIDADKWPLRYPEPCPQQGSGDDCGIFTCKYMECLARRDIQDLPFSQDDMPLVRAKMALHFIKAYFNGQGRS